MIEGYEYSIEQLNLLIHNCNVYGLHDKKKEYIKMLNELEEKEKKNTKQFGEAKESSYI